MIFQGTFTSMARMGIAAVAGLWGPRRQPIDDRRRTTPVRPMKSWVVLCGSRVHFVEDELRRMLDDVFPGHFLPPRDDAGFVVGGPSPDPFMIRSNSPGAAGLFMLLSVQGRYVSADRLASIADGSLRRLVLAQPAWFSIDLIQGIREESDADVFISRALARIAPPDAAVLLHPTRPTTFLFDASMRRHLEAGLTPDQGETAT